MGNGNSFFLSIFKGVLDFPHYNGIMWKCFGVLPFCALILSCSTSPTVRSGKLEFVPLEEEVSILRALPLDLKIVQFADTVHLTQEVPLAERRLIERLAAERGFGMIATSGSPFDAWISMETLLNGRAGAERNVKEARLRGAANLDQTAEFEEIYESIRNKKNAPVPLYLTGFDPTVGSSYGWRNQFLFRFFLQSLKEYGLKKDLALLEKEIEPLESLKTCMEKGFPRTSADATRIKMAIGNLRGWIKSVFPNVRERYPDLPHAAALKLLPLHFEQALDLCATHGVPARRFELGAQYLIETMNRVAEQNRMVVLAPYRLVGYGVSTELNVGDRLRKQFEGGVFTFITLPLAGEGIAGAVVPPTRVKLLGNETQLQWFFRNFKNPGLILNLSLSPLEKSQEPLFQKKMVWLDGEKIQSAPALAGDGFLIFPKVRPTKKWYLDHLIDKK